MARYGRSGSFKVIETATNIDTDDDDDDDDKNNNKNNMFILVTSPVSDAPRINVV